MIGRTLIGVGTALREPLAAALIGSAAVHFGAIALLVAMDRANHITVDTGGIVTVEIVVSDGPEVASTGTEGQPHMAVRADPPPDVARRERTPAETVAHAPPESLRRPIAKPAAAAPIEAASILRPEPAPAAQALDPPHPPRPKPDIATAMPVPEPSPADAREEPAAPTHGHDETAEPTTAGDLASQQASLPGASDRGAAPLAANPSPVYPRQARLRGVEGQVVLRVEVTPEGHAAAVSVTRSSGDVSLDAAAEAAVRQWRFTPAIRDGARTADQVFVPVRFQLR